MSGEYDEEEEQPTSLGYDNAGSRYYEEGDDGEGEYEESDDYGGYGKDEFDYMSDSSHFRAAHITRIDVHETKVCKFSRTLYVSTIVEGLFIGI